MSVGDIYVDKDGCKYVVTGEDAVAHTREQQRLTYINQAIAYNRDVRIAVRDAIIGKPPTKTEPTIVIDSLSSRHHG